MVKKGYVCQNFELESNSRAWKCSRIHTMASSKGVMDGCLACLGRGNDS